MMSACPACCAVSASTCNSTRRADQLAPSRTRAPPEWLRRVQVGEGPDQVVGVPGHLVVSGQQPGQRLPLQHPESIQVGPYGRLVRGHGRRAHHDELGPLPFGLGDVLDRAAHAQRTGGGALRGLLVGQAAGREAQEVALLGQGVSRSARSPVATSVLVMARSAFPSVLYIGARYGRATDSSGPGR